MEKTADYETTFVLSPEQTEEEREASLERIKTTIEGNEGEIMEIDEWGERRLAYPINDLFSGYYVVLDFQGDSQVVDELERNFKLIGDLLRYLIVRKDK